MNKAPEPTPRNLPVPGRRIETKILRIGLCLMIVATMAGCATCRPESTSQVSNPITREEQKHPFWDWFTEQLVNNLFGLAACR